MMPRLERQCGIRFYVRDGGLNVVYALLTASLSTFYTRPAALDAILGRVRVRRSVWSKVVLALWAAVLAAFWLYVHWQDEGLLELFRGWLTFLRSGVTGPLLFLIIYLVRPFLLVPITLLTVASGFLFGALWGFLYAWTATLLSSALAYLFGRYVAGDVTQVSARFVESLRTRAFETVLISRFLFVPGDLVNYASGVLRISFRAFLLATAVGGVPGLLIGVLAGASIEGEFGTSGVRLNVWYLLASGVLLVSSLALSAFLRRRQPQ